MGVRFLRFDILPSSPLGSLEQDELETTEAGAGEIEGESGEGDAMQEDDEEAFCRVIEPGNAGRRLN